VVNGWQHWAPHASPYLWSNLHLSGAPGASPSIEVGGTYTGSLNGAAAQLDKLYSMVGSGPSTHFLGQNTYLQAMLIEAGCSGESVPQCHRGAGRAPFYARSDYITHALSRTGINAALTAVENMRGVAGAAGASGSIAFDSYGGAINAVAPGATAFVHRNTLYGVQYYTEWDNPGSASGVANQRRWLNRTYNGLHPHASGQAYQNYLDASLTNWRQAYYGANYPRLSRIKGRYDPHMLFNFPQAITPPS
jgi:hypothetical protein